MILLNIIFWTILVTAWLASAIICGIMGRMHVDDASDAYRTKRDLSPRVTDIDRERASILLKYHMKLAFMYWAGCVATVASFFITVLFVFA